MILVNFSDLVQQVVLTANMKKAVQFLRRSDLETLPAGRMEIDGSKVFAIISSFTTKPAGEILELEGHRKYIDIHTLLSGREAMGWASTENVPVTKAYDARKDSWTGNLPAAGMTLLLLKAGQAVVFYPADAHAPQLADGEPMPVKKIVVKVACLD